LSSIRSIVKNFARNAELNEFLKEKVSDAGYGGVDIVKTPLGSSLTVYVTRPGLVIGRRGVGIKSLTEEVEKRFNLTNLQISVLEVEFPELHPLIMANRLAQTVARGTPFRRSANWTWSVRPSMYGRIIIFTVQFADLRKGVPLATVCASLFAIIRGWSSGNSTSRTEIWRLVRLKRFSTSSVRLFIPTPRRPITRPGLVT